MPITIDPRVILELHRELLAAFRGFTIHPTSMGRWQNRAGRLFQEEVIVYEVAIPEDKVPVLRDIVCRLGLRLGQQAMYFDAPAPSVEIIELPGGGGPADEPGKNKTTGRRSKKNRPSG